MAHNTAVYLTPALDILAAHPITVTAFFALFISGLVLNMGWFTKSDYQPKGKHCYVTGGSSGLGKALSESLVRQGAHVTIVARDLKKGEEVADELRTLAQTLGYPTQKIVFISADLTNPTEASKALTRACEPFGGRAPDYIMCCAGFSRPKFLIDSTPEEMKSGLDGVYWVSAYTAQAAAQLMIKQRRIGKILLVSSFLGYTSFAGYTNYSPGKYALRGLADALRSEMLLHDISVHIYMPCGIIGPGLEAENAEKPAVTHKIEEGDTPIMPADCVKYLESGLRKGHYQITDNIVADFVRLRSNGGMPTNNFFLDTFYLLVSTIGVPIWRMTADYEVKKAKKSVEADLEARGIYDILAKNRK